MIVCGSCGEENPDQAKFCLACGSPVAAAEPAVKGPAEERKLITVLFVDVVGSTARAEQLDPEDVKAMLAPYHARAREELDRFGGRLEKFVGDAVLALFGVPVAHEDDPERAVRAALAIRDAVAELNAADSWLDLHIRIGVHTGEALVTLDARPDRGEWTAAGDVMNTAARLQSGAPTDGILVGAETYRATRDTIEYREHEPLAAKGKAGPVPVWEVVGALEDEPAAPRAGAPLVGREEELERIWALWEQIERSRRPGLAAVLGPPGIGKSRLVTEVARRLYERSGVLWGRCLSYGEGITYWPIVEILKQAAGITHDDDERATSAKLGRLLAGLRTADRDQLRTMAAALANLIGVPTTPEGTYSAAEIGQAELHWGIRRVVELLSASRPLVLVFEDLHWAEPTLFDLLETLMGDQKEAPYLLLCSARPEAREARRAFFADGDARRSVELEALSAEDSEALLAELIREEGLPASTAARVLENAGGNPLFLEETVRMLGEVGDFGEGNVETLPVPTSLQALIGSRLDQVPPAGKQVAQQASVIGSVFWPGAVAHLGANGDLARGLSDLERRDLIRAKDTSSVAGEDEYAFKHVLIRDVAYGRVPKGERARLHARFAEWTQALPGGDDELIEILAYHLEQACLFARAVARAPEPPPIEAALDALVRAAEKAERREGLREARRFFERGLALVGDERPDRRTDLRFRRARTLAALGDLRQAHAELLEVAVAALEIDRDDLRGAALVALANVEQKQGRAADARGHLNEAQALSRETGDRRLQIRAGYELGALLADFDGAVDDSADVLRTTLAIAEELDDRALRIEGHMRMATLLFNKGELAESEDQLIRCSDLASELGSHRDEARAACLLSLVRFYRGELEQAEQVGLQAREWLERTSESYFQLQNSEALAKFALARHRPDVAEEHLREALPLALESGGWLLIDIYRYLTEALVAQARMEDARELVGFAARNLPEEDLFAQAALLLAEARVAAAAGEKLSATSSFEEAVRLLDEQQLLIEAGEARLAFGRALRRFGEETGARAELERSRAIFKRMGAPVLLAEVDAELAALTERAGNAGPLASS